MLQNTDTVYNQNRKTFYLGFRTCLRNGSVLNLKSSGQKSPPVWKRKRCTASTVSCPRWVLPGGYPCPGPGWGEGVPLSWSWSGMVTQSGPGWRYPVLGPDWDTRSLWSGPGQGYPLLPPESTWDQRLGRDLGPEAGVPPRKDLGPETGKGPPKQTHTSENITSCRTMCAGGNNSTNKYGLLVSKQFFQVEYWIIPHVPNNKLYWFRMQQYG